MSHSETAKRLVCGDRNDDYGNPKPDFERVALAWSGVIGEKLKANLTAVEVGLMMVVFKCVRHAHKAKDDNLVDGHGYFDCIEWIETGVKPASQAQIVEDVACGAKLACFTCGKSLPCMCEHGKKTDDSPGAGWRWLESTETVEFGDEWHMNGAWHHVFAFGYTAHQSRYYRRRITP